MSLSREILPGLASGIVAGAFPGRLFSILGLVASLFVRLFRMTSLHHMTLSIISDLER